MWLTSFDAVKMLQGSSKLKAHKTLAWFGKSAHQQHHLPPEARRVVGQFQWRMTLTRCLIFTI